MGTTITATRLYDLLLPKIGSEAAECLADYIDNKTKEEMEHQLAGIATKEDLFSLRQDFFNFWEKGRGEMDNQKEGLRGEMGTLKNELCGRMSGVEEKLRGEMSSLKEEVRKDIGTLRTEIQSFKVEIEKGFRQQFWLIVVLFLPLYLTLAVVAF